MSNEDLDFVKTSVKETAVSSYWNYNNNVLRHLFKEEFHALQNPNNYNEIGIQKSDKNDSVNSRQNRLLR